MLKTLVRFIDHLFEFEFDATYAEAMKRNAMWWTWEQGYKAGVRNSLYGDVFMNPYGGQGS